MVGFLLMFIWHSKFIYLVMDGFCCLLILFYFLYLQSKKDIQQLRAIMARGFLRQKFSSTTTPKKDKDSSLFLESYASFCVWIVGCYKFLANLYDSVVVAFRQITE